jgi:hypothetical protein
VAEQVPHQFPPQNANASLGTLKSMSKWVELPIARVRLATLWNIPQPIVEQIVRNVAQSGKAQLRAVPAHGSVPQFITSAELNLHPKFLGSFDWDLIEIDWNDLLPQGRKLMPTELVFARHQEGKVGDDDLKSASKTQIDEQIFATYDDIEAAAGKPPNVKEIIPLVQERLRALGYHASGRRIQELAGADKYKRRRGKVGKTMASERRR